MGLQATVSSLFQSMSRMEAIKVEFEYSSDEKGNVEDFQRNISCDSHEEQQSDFVAKQQLGCFKQIFLTECKFESTHRTSSDCLDQILNDNCNQLNNNSSSAKYECKTEDTFKCEQNYPSNGDLPINVNMQGDTVDALFEEKNESVDLHESKDIVHQFIHNEGNMLDNDAEICKQHPVVEATESFTKMMDRRQSSDLDVGKNNTTNFSSRANKFEVGYNANNCTRNNDEQNDGGFECTFYDSTTEHVVPLTRHSNGVSQKYVCGSCKFSSISESILRDHVTVQHSAESFSQVHVIERGADDLEVSYENVVRSNGRHWQCHLCEYRSRRRDRLRSHIDSVHFAFKRYKCSSCDYSSGTLGFVKTHLNEVHSQVRNFKCDTCDYSSSRRIGLKKHVEAVHLKMRNYKCSLCGRQFYHKNNHKKHMRAVHSLESCFQSGFEYYRKLDLASPENDVRFKKKFKCDSCDFECHKKYQLTSHVNSVHLKLKHVKCPMCDYSAPRKCVRKHVEDVHLKLTS